MNVHHYINVNYASSVAQLWPDAVFDDCGVRWDSLDSKLFFSTTSLCSASYIGCQCNTARICCEPAAPLLHAEGTCSWYAAPAPASVDRCLMPEGRSAANPSATDAAVDRWDRQTDGRSTVS